MPIKPDNRARYPVEWPAIRAGIRERAGDRCEADGCGIPNYAVGLWIPTGDGPAWRQHAAPATYAEARAIADSHNAFNDGGERLIVIVLTVAHLDHQPENCDPANLRCWCQRHHLAYDQQHHRVNAFQTRRRSSHTPDLFDHPELQCASNSTEPFPG